MKINIGDKFLCKKTNKGHDLDIGVEESVWYEVVKIDEVPSELEHMNVSRYVKVNVGVFDYSFCINKETNSDYIWHYFYKPKELLNKKLNKVINS